MEGAIAQQSHSMLGHLCLPFRQASFRLSSRHSLLSRQRSGVSRCFITSASGPRGDQEPSQPPHRVQRGRSPLPPVQAWRSYQSGFAGDLLADAPGGGCSCCGDYYSMREGRSLISRSEAGPSNRNITTVPAAATAQAEAVRSHEEEAEALEDYVKRRIQLFEMYKNREVQAVSSRIFWLQ